MTHQYTNFYIANPKQLLVLTVSGIHHWAVSENVKEYHIAIVMHIITKLCIAGSYLIIVYYTNNGDVTP